MLLYVGAIVIGVFVPDVGSLLYLAVAIYTVATTRSVDFDDADGDLATAS